MLPLKKRKNSTQNKKDELQPYSKKRKKSSPQVEKTRRNVTKSLMFDLNLSDHHTLPFNELITKWLKDIVLNHGNIQTVFRDELYTLTCSNYRFVRGPMLPSDAHTYNESYSGEIIVDIREMRLTTKECNTMSDHVEYPYVYKDVLHENMKIADFPVMLDSTGCHFSEGYDIASQTEPEYAGGFIVKGKRRFIPLLKAIVNNFPFRFYNKNKHIYSVQVRSEHLDRKHRSTSTLEIVLDGEKAKRSSVFHNVMVKVPFLTPPVPITIIVLGLGWSIDDFEEAIKSSAGSLWDPVLFKKYMIMLRHDHHGCKTQEDALLFIGRLYGKVNNTTTAKHMLKSEILPHLNNFHHDLCKGYYLAYIYGMLVLFKEGRLSATERDSRVYTRLVDSGTSLAFLFRMLFLTFVKQGLKIMRRVMNQEKEIDVSKIYNHRRLTQKIMSALATGTWSKQRKGVSHPMTTTNEQAIISQLRRISSSYLNNDGKHVEPRMVHKTQCGYECGAETPEGEACGLVYSLASTARVTCESNAESLMDYLLSICRNILLPFPQPIEAIKHEYYKVFDPYGRFIGWCTDIDQLNEKFLNARRSMSIDPFVSRFQDSQLKEWRVHCDIGRPCRPLLVVKNLYKVHDLVENSVPGQSLLPVLMANGCLEYVGPSEEQTLTVAFALPKNSKDANQYSHLEVADISFVGIIAALSPFFRHNQGPRLVYWISMSKQAIGTSTKRDMGAATTHNLWYGQKPIVTTQTSRDLNMDQIPDCINCVLLMFPWSRNQEDAIIMSRSFSEKGGFVSDSIRTYTSEKQGKYNDVSSEKFEKPIKGQTFGLKQADYTKLQKNGLPNVGQPVDGGDIVIGKTVPIKKISSSAVVNAPRRLRSSEYQKKRRDKSIQVRDDEKGVVDTVLLAHKPQCEMAKVSVRSIREPEIGDKFSSRHSQKGTVGQLANPEDMPFSMETGMIPDIIMSPLGITSRMTMGKVIEIVLGKSAALTGDLLDSLDDQDFETPFEERLETIRNIFKKAGFHSSGKEIFCDGKTGEMIEIPVMCGIVSYAKLNHMVSRKAHARATGPVHMLTRQPNEGRRQGGGLRFGPMEVECTLAHSTAEILRERMLKASAPFTCYVCAECGLIADGNPNIDYYFCRMCRTGKHVKHVMIDFATKLMTQELNATGIKVKLGLVDVEE